MSRTTDQPPGDNRPPVYWEGDDLIIRASALGTSCLYELVAAGQGYEPATLPKSLLRAFAEGHALEPVVIEELENHYHIHFLSHQNEYDWVVEPGLIVRFHPDGEANLGSQFYHLTKAYRNLRWDRAGIRERPPRTIIVEVKALSDALWQKFRAHGMASVIDEYPWQLSVMMAYASQPGLWVGYNKGNPPDPETGIKPPCPDEGKLYFELVVDTPIGPHTLVDKARKVKELVCGEDILDAGSRCTDPTNWPCRYLHVRPEATMEETPENTWMVEREDHDEIEQLLRDYRYHKGAADEHASKAKLLKELLIDRAGPHTHIETDTWQVPIINGANTSADWVSMQEDGIEVGKYKKRTEYRYIGKYKRKDDIDGPAD